MTSLYLDLDGVMADFDTHYSNVFGERINRDLTDEEWQAIHAQGGFFADMPLCHDALELFQYLNNPIVLTACPSSNYASVARQKRHWVRKHLGTDVRVLPVMGGHNKPLFMHSAGDILIDDYGKNCRAWTTAGGVAVKHENTLETIRQLKELGL